MSTKRPSVPAAAASPPPNKKQRFTPSAAAAPMTITAAADMTVLHQSTHLSFVLQQRQRHRRRQFRHVDSSSSSSVWNMQGRSSLYLILPPPPTKHTQNHNNNCIALHLRRSCCRVTDVRVETLVKRDEAQQMSAAQQQQQQQQQNTTTTTLKNDNRTTTTTTTTTTAWRMKALPGVTVQHHDPLSRVLIKPPSSYTTPPQDDDDIGTKTTRRCEADAQSIRGAAGMTKSLRAAGLASHMGELRVQFLSSEDDTTTTTNNVQQQQQQQQQLTREEAQEGWKEELLQRGNATTTTSGGGGEQGCVEEELREQLDQRATRTRERRIALVARRLAEATCSGGAVGAAASSSSQDAAATGSSSSSKAATTGSIRVVKLTVHYQLSEPPYNHADDATTFQQQQQQQHLGGLHLFGGGGGGQQTPHVYTTAGLLGDPHEGPRCWMPCLDSAASSHRASHEWSIRVTAPLREGLSVVGCGEDLGVSKTLLHDDEDSSCWREEEAALRAQLGEAHVQLLLRSAARAAVLAEDHDDGNREQPHVIPPDDEASSPSSSMDSILATTIWVSHAWTPTCARALGFAIGPFKILEDPEYFDDQEEEEEEEEEQETESRKDIVEAARRNGEGIRQAYFAPLFERKFLHSRADVTLLPNTHIVLAPLSRRHLDMSRRLEETVAAATAGVVHRALSCMRDVLALPATRTSSYTQVWIPGAVHGGSTSGALHCCPDVLVNPFLGGAIMDSRLLPAPGGRLPFHHGGRVLQMMQARNAVRGWITAALPLGGRDDVGTGYILALIESLLMSLYERGHGACGEGGAKRSVYFTKRYAAGSGLNSANFDFLPIANIEEGELDTVVGGVVGAIPVEDRHSDQLWRTATNGTESHTSSLDEFNVRQLLYKDSVDALERGTNKDKYVPMPSMGWLGSHLSLTYLSSNASSSTELGCGALELLHPVGGAVYRTLKSELLRRVIEGRAGLANCIRLIRGAFIAAHLEDLGEKEVKIEEKPKKMRKKERSNEKTDGQDKKAEPPLPKMQPPFVVCVDEMLKKHGFTHTLFTRALRIIAGPIREPHLRGTLVDIERELRHPSTHRQFVEPEGFPNSYVRGASELFLRVGAHVDAAGSSETGSSSVAPVGSVAVKGTQLHVLAEPVIPEGGIAFGGPITVRVVENDGQLREFVRALNSDGSRCEWGPVFLHAKPVTTARQQTAASGAIERSAGALGTKESGGVGSGDKGSSAADGSRQLLPTTVANSIFTEECLHSGGYQAIELMRLTNLTPLLWVRVDPLGMYGGRISISQPDACVAEQIFHDGDATAQVEAIRALAERPFRIQGSVKVKTVYDVEVSELPVRVLGDCLRGSPALHRMLPHTPAVRVQAALAIAQWQNNKAPANQEVVGPDSWVGLDLLIQYFRERYYNKGIIVPVKFTRLVLKNSEAAIARANLDEGDQTGAKSGEEDLYQYPDTIEDEAERSRAIADADELELEEDEEYRVRSAVITAISCIRAQDGRTPRAVLEFLEAVLVSGDASMVGTPASNDKVTILQQRRPKTGEDEVDDRPKDSLVVDHKIAALTYVPSTMVADALEALNHINASPPVITDPATGKPVQSKAKHPVVPLIEACHRWLEWELYRETVRAEVESETRVGVGGYIHSTIAACAITALSSLSILRQVTTDSCDTALTSESPSETSKSLDMMASAKFYIEIFDSKPCRSDVTRAACAQALACICCAADRLEIEKVDPLGLLTALEFLLDRILDEHTSPGLRQTLALLMLDSCTGKVCSMQRVAAIGGRGDLCTSATRFFNGPLGSSHGGDNGSALMTTVSESTYPAASAVNDGARRGLRLLREEQSDQVVVRVAKFATVLWRTINGDCTPPLSPGTKSRTSGIPPEGVCAFDGHLRCTLLSLWQWIWPKGCGAVLRVQAWRPLQGTQRYKDLGADVVMKITNEEKEGALAEEASLADLHRLVSKELDRQRWRGEMAMAAFAYHKQDEKKSTASDVPVGSAEQGIGQPLPPIQRDQAFKQGGWIASAAQQRRALALDGGHAVTKIRLTVKGSGGD